MAHIYSMANNDCKNYTPQRRRELFPTADDDSDELGHISPLSDSTPPDSPNLLPCPEDKLIEQNIITTFSQSTISDYIILENICNNDKHNLIEENSSENRTPLSNRHCYETNENTMSPLYLSPMQAIINSSSPKKFKENSPCLNDSPSSTLKTPQSTSIINVEVPKLIRKSPLVKSSTNIEAGKRKMPFSDSPSAHKHPKLDPSSRVRTVLFPQSDIVVPTASFYTKSNPGYPDNTFRNVNIKTKKTNYKSSSLYLCGRKGSNKRGFGQINAGVKHKIRKPKPKKIADTHLLKAALNIIDKSPLNNYLNGIKNIYSKEQLLQKEINVPQMNEDKISEELDQEITQSRKRELSPSPDLSKKFFKFKRSNATVTVDKHLKLEMNEGKLSILANKKYNNKKYKTANQLKLNLDATDLIVPENENLISPEKIDDILYSLDNNDYDKENNKNPIQEMNLDKELQECTEQLVLEAHNSVAMSENAIHLHTVCENQQYRNDNNLNLNCSLVPKQMSNNEKFILLSPTSQMCNMTSGLALNSPKRAKQNITNILTNNSNFNNKPEESFNEISFASEMEQEKLYPIFCGTSKVPSKNNVNKTPKINQKKLKPLPKDQMLLDAGQKKFGATQCNECKFVYHMGDPNDELLHLNYHNAGNILRFTGWKDEHVMAQFTNARIIRVVPSDPKSWLKKVKDLLEVVNRDLGYYEMQTNLDNSQVYLYIKHKTIAGCLVAEPKSYGYRMLSDNIGIDLCSEQSYPIKCGISRIWVSQSCRKEGIATALVNSLRGNFLYGSILAKNDIAFSSPTEAGKAFAIKYFNTPNFLIYSY